MSIRSFAFFSGLLAATASLFAQSSVWKVSRGGSTLYLGGTCHVVRPADFPPPAEFDLAFRASAKVFFETDIARLQSPDMQALVATEGMFLDGRTLDQALTPAAWKAVAAYSAKSGLPLDQVKRFKPWFFTVMVAALEMQKLGVSLEGVDLHYFRHATQAGKGTGELEVFEDHMRFLVQMGVGHESEMVASTLEDIAELPAMIGSLLDAWKSGDLAGIDDFLLKDLRVKYPAIYRDLLVSRNRAWLPRIEELLQTREVEFVLVGVGHLPGKDGLLAALRERGCALEPVKAPPAPRNTPAVP